MITCEGYISFFCLRPQGKCTVRSVEQIDWSSRILTGQRILVSPASCFAGGSRGSATESRLRKLKSSAEPSAALRACHVPRQRAALGKIPARRLNGWLRPVARVPEAKKQGSETGDCRRMPVSVSCTANSLLPNAAFYVVASQIVFDT
jgi:hypothetical protein